MSDVISLTFVLAAGFLFGGIFYLGLWFTTEKGMKSARPALWFLGSMLLRTGIVIGGLLVVCGDDWQRWLICLIGFSLARPLVQMWVNRQGEKTVDDDKEISCAP